ncbi:HAMP domain-containing sensor histidine kinase [Paucibacter sp. R3-3]|uniref:histidine kinase n=1 Tax=Roseateles agri TaxID=3098619 RepID=A0ABU5DBW9_9BURK|nr:HAMP domain-containing sensor histidine kinase [Paucibacter sp. R3-3]MDY0743768.1 HAMP domain-containing sensor histidine kinase [Paucibacter sp. R3-3]
MQAPASTLPDAIADALAPAPTPRGLLRRRVALLLATLLGLLVAAAVLGLQLVLGAPAGLLPWLAGLLALVLLLGAVLAGGWLLRQEREARRSEARTRQLVLELRRQRDEALAASDAKTRFLTQLSHELRVPLHAISGFAQLLQMEGGELPCRWVCGIVEAAAHMQALTEDLFDIARIEAGGLRLKIQPLALAPLVADALRLLQPLAERADVRLLPADGGEGLRVLADLLRLRQVLLNLIGNAIKYGRPGGRVRIELEAGRDLMQLRVVDDGIGMDAQQLARLFEPFNRLGREKGPVAGSGVGLVLAQQLMRLMQGEIHVESRPGVGTTVHLRLPVTDPHPPA